MNHDHPIELALHVSRISGKTHWLFVELTLADGRKGVGEATLPGKDAQVLAAAQQLASQALQANWRAAPSHAR